MHKNSICTGSKRVVQREELCEGGRTSDPFSTFETRRGEQERASKNATLPRSKVQLVEILISRLLSEIKDLDLKKLPRLQKKAGRAPASVGLPFLTLRGGVGRKKRTFRAWPGSNRRLLDINCNRSQESKPLDRTPSAYFDELLPQFRYEYLKTNSRSRALLRQLRSPLYLF